MGLTEIYNWHRVNENITSSGQFSEEQFTQIAELGVTHVINMGLHDHEYALPDEESLVKKHGIEYIYQPVDFNKPTDDDFSIFCETMKMLEGQTIHIHCIANYRISAFLYRYYRDVKKEGAEKAKQDMLSIWQPEGVWAEFIRD